MEARIASNATSDFARVMEVAQRRSCAQHKKSGQLNLDQDKIKNGLGRLVLTLVKLLHELLERQAVRRVDSGTLTDSEIEKIGVTLMMQAQEIMAQDSVIDRGHPQT